MNIQESRAKWAADKVQLERFGLIFPDVQGYLTSDMKQDFHIAQDALPALGSAPNAGIPALLSTYMDPEVIRYLFSPIKAAEIYGERKAGDWLYDTIMFQTVESTGETSAYGDYSENGRSGVNQDFPQRQSFHFQVMEEYGEREMERAGLTKLDYVAEINRASAESLNRFQNYSYFFGINGLQNYGALNDPYLPASLTPSPKAWGGTKWINNGTIVATANEIYNDFQAAIYQLVNQTAGLIEEEDDITVVLAPQVRVALTATNSFGVDVYKLLKQNFPKLKIETAVQLGAVSTTNPFGIAAGNMMQMFAPKMDGVQTVFCGYTEKMRAHTMERRTSSFKRKMTSGTWGTTIRYPIAFTSMVGL